MTDYGPRHRERIQEEQSSTITFVERQSELYGDSIAWDSPKFFVSKKVEEIMDDVVLEKFARTLASGKCLPCNPMTKETVKTTRSPSVRDYRYKTSTSTYHYGGDLNLLGNAQGCSLELYPDETDTIVQEAATLSAYAAVDSAEVQVLATLAELADTRTMLVSAVKNIGKITKKIVKLNQTLREIEIYPKNHGDLLKTAEQTWMGIRMGWRPFAGECQQLYNAITKAQRPVWKTFRGCESVNRAKTESGKYLKYPFSVSSMKMESQTVVAKTVVLCEQRAGGFPDTFGLTQIPSTLYNIMPLSWAVDYFFNFGDLIAASTPDALWRPICVSGVTTREHYIENSLGSDPSSSRPDYTGGYYGGKVTWSKTTKVRRSDPPRAGILTSVKLNWQKFTDVAIVGRQQFANARRKLFSQSSRMNPRLRRRIFNAR